MLPSTAHNFKFSLISSSEREFLSFHFNTSEELIILSTGNCAGKVVCKNLVVEAGGILNAEVTCISDQSIKKK